MCLGHISGSTASIHPDFVLIDRFMPKYDLIEHHEVLVHAPRDRTYSAVWAVDLSRSLPILLLVAIRGMPMLFSGRVRPRRRITLEFLLDYGFVLLQEEPGVEIVLGAVGKFWRLTGGLRSVQLSNFVGFREPEFAKAVINFRVEELSVGTSLVSTETRVTCTDEAARRKFLRYWKLVGPFSALIRRLALGLAKKDAEQQSSELPSDWERKTANNRAANSRHLEDRAPSRASRNLFRSSPPV